MGSFDCYCALCGGPLSHSLAIGFDSAKALARRKRRLERAKRRRAGETDLSDSEDETEDSDMEWEGEEEEYDVDHCYNPELVSESSTEWVGNCRCLGFNADAPGINKAFISGRGFSPDYGEFIVREPPGDDPNDPGEESYNCYDSDIDIIAFPFHETCLKVLCRSLFGHENVMMIDKDILHSVFSQLKGEMYPCQLLVDYGGIEGMEQIWDCISGEEYSVSDPMIDPEIAATIRIEMSRRTFDKLPTKLDFGRKVRNDPFLKLPHDILNLLFPYLPHEAVLAFRQASWHVFKSTCDNSFWRRMIRREILPWSWELEPSLILDTVNARLFYLWLHKVTTHTFGMEGPFMSIANRRRIWHVCEEVRKIYMERVAQEAELELGGRDDKNAMVIMEKSTSLQMPIVLHPQPKESVLLSQQWIRSWDELHHPSKVFESFWDPKGRLAGLGVKFGSERRIFGQGEGKEFGITVRAVPIPADEWIKEIVLHLSDINLLKQPAKTASITALSITLTSGNPLELMEVVPGLNERVLAVTPDTHLTGLVGQIGPPDANNTAPPGVSISRNTPLIISRLGILQYARPSEEPAETPTLTQVQRLLWKEAAAKLALNGAMYGSTAPIWSHPRFRMIPFDIPGELEEVPIDVLPHEVLLWAKDKDELKRLTRISAFVIEDGHITIGGRKRPVHAVLGIRAEYEERYWEPKRTIGSGTKSAELKESESDNWADEYLVHFDIDGPGGELVTEIHVADEARAIKLLTNRGREGYFGEVERDYWHVKRPEEGEVLVGMVVCFGTRCGLNWETKKYNHVKTTTATGLVMPTKRNLAAQ